MSAPIPSTIDLVFQLHEKILARDAILIGLVQIILGDRSADDLKASLSQLDRQIEGRE